MNVLLKILKAKRRNEIRKGKLWEITRIWGIDIHKKEQEVVKPLPVVRSTDAARVDAVRVHSFKDENNVTNLTKKPDLL